MKKRLVICFLTIVALSFLPNQLPAQGGLRLEKLSESLVYLSRARILIDEATRCCEQQQHLVAINCLNQASGLIEAAKSSLPTEIMTHRKRVALQEDIASLKDMVDSMKKNTQKIMLLEQLLKDLEQKSKKIPDKSSL